MQSHTFIGGDVSKAEICFASYGTDNVERIANQKAALQLYLASLPTDSLLAVEATNNYHQMVVELAHAQGLGVYVLNPNDLHHYARSIGVRGKTDPVDARMIARYVAKEHAELHAWLPVSTVQKSLQVLLNRRSTLVTTRLRMQQSLRDTDELKPVLRALELQFAKALAVLDKAIVRRLQQEPELASFAAGLRAIPGVGPLVSAALAMLMYRHDFSSADAVVAYVGLDPRPRESGTYRGQRKLSKRGPAELRRLLYVAAMTTARHAAIKVEYARHLAKGLSATAVYNILARKLLRTAWSMLKHSRPFDIARFVSD